MTKLRHPTMSFNFNTPGEVFEVPDEDVAYLCSEYGCEVIGTEETLTAPPEFIPPPEFTESDADEHTSEPPPDPDPDPDDFAIPKRGGWYEYQGQSYRFSALPPEAIVLEE